MKAGSHARGELWSETASADEFSTPQTLPSTPAISVATKPRTANSNSVFQHKTLQWKRCFISAATSNYFFACADFFACSGMGHDLRRARSFHTGCDCRRSFRSFLERELDDPSRQTRRHTELEWGKCTAKHANKNNELYLLTILCLSSGKKSVAESNVLA